MPDYNKQIVIVGYSGHSYVVLEAALTMNLKIHGYLEKVEIERNPYGLVYLGDETDSVFKKWSEFGFILGIGNNLIREKALNKILKKKGELLNVIHKDSSVSNDVQIGMGSFIARNASINPFCRIGDGAIINTSASIDHECILKNGAHIAPGAVLAGNVNIGINSFIGANSVVKEGVSIGDNVIIGAGTVVLKNVPSNTKMVGNPARKL